jgi:dTDP-4-amino-4,6-dideoxygalactose transaminase
MNKRIYLSSPTMHGLEMDYIQEAFDTNWVAPLGKNVDEFENEMAAYVGVKHASALVSGTSALHLAVKLCGVKPGDIVVCSDLTFSATVNPVSYEGGIQVFVDSEYDTWNMDPRALEIALKKYPQAKAVLVAHLYGTPSKMDEIQALCEQYNVPLIEDAAESLGATYKGRQTGTFGKYAALSLVVLKNRIRCQVSYLAINRRQTPLIEESKKVPGFLPGSSRKASFVRLFKSVETSTENPKAA